MEPTREIYGNIVGGELVYLAMVVSFGLLGWALYRHYCLWMQGRPDNRVQNLWRRLKVMLVQGLGQQKTLREWPGLLLSATRAGARPTCRSDLRTASRGQFSSLGENRLF